MPPLLFGLALLVGLFIIAAAVATEATDTAADSIVDMFEGSGRDIHKRGSELGNQTVRPAWGSGAKLHNQEENRAANAAERARPGSGLGSGENDLGAFETAEEEEESDGMWGRD